MSHLERQVEHGSGEKSRGEHARSLLDCSYAVGTWRAPRSVGMVRVTTRARGFTLLEALVVVALLGIVAAIVGGILNATYQKMRLETAVNDIGSLLESAHESMINVQGDVFVGLLKEPWRLRVARDAALTDVVREFAVPEYVSFSIAAVDGVQTNWPAVGPNGPWLLRLDTFGRTTTAAGAPVTAVQTLAVTHRDVVTGRLKPRLRYEVRIYPLWRVETAKEVLP